MPRFETLRIGCVTLRTDPEFRWDVRLVREVEPVGHYYVVAMSAARGPFVDPGEAMRDCAHSFPEAAMQLQWRDSLDAQPDEHACPICAAPRHTRDRYRHAVCPACVLESVDEEGQSLRFYCNSSSGLWSERPDKMKRIGDQPCWIRGIRCWAEEARAGGALAIQPHPPTPKR